MKAIKVMANINNQGEITLDKPLISNKNSKVELIVLIPDSDCSPTEVEIDHDDDSDAKILENLRQSLADAKSGKTYDIAELWEGIDAE